MAKVGISSDIIKPFSGRGDVLAWLKKVRLVAKLEQLDNVASVLALYLDGDTLAVYMEIEEEEEEEEEEDDNDDDDDDDDDKQREQMEGRLKEMFTDDALAAQR